MATQTSLAVVEEKGHKDVKTSFKNDRSSYLPIDLQRPPLVKATLRLVSVGLCAAAERLPRLVRRKVAILGAFTVVLLKSFKSCLLFFVALSGLIDTLAQLLAWRSML